MFLKLLADTVLLVHFAFVLFAVFGGGVVATDVASTVVVAAATEAVGTSEGVASAGLTGAGWAGAARWGPPGCFSGDFVRGCARPNAAHVVDGVFRTIDAIREDGAEARRVRYERRPCWPAEW